MYLYYLKHHYQYKHCRLYMCECEDFTRAATHSRGAPAEAEAAAIGGAVGSPVTPVWRLPKVCASCHVSTNAGRAKQRC